MDSYSSKQRETLSALLSDLKNDLEEAIASGKEATQPVELSKPIGRLTRMDEIQQQNMAKASLTANKKRLVAVEAAQKALEEGTYGECISCGELIPIARLMARPEAKLCVECKEEKE